VKEPDHKLIGLFARLMPFCTAVGLEKKLREQREAARKHREEREAAMTMEQRIERARLNRIVKEENAGIDYSANMRPGYAWITARGD
jgi:hypothetical protein